MEKRQTKYPWWKSVLWLLGIAIYTVLSTGLSYLLFFLAPVSGLLHTFLGSLFWGAPILGLWVLLLAVPGWQLMLRKRTWEGASFILLAAAALAFSIFFLAEGGFREPTFLY